MKVSTSSIAVIAKSSQLHHTIVDSIVMLASRDVTIRFTAAGGVNCPIATLIVASLKKARV